MSAIVSGDRVRSHGELMERALRAGAGFRAMGVGPDSAVALLLRNDFCLFEAARGAALSGGYFVPINWHFTGDEVRYILQDCSAAVLVIHADLLPQVKAFVPPTVDVLVVETPPEIASAYGVGDACVPAGMSGWEQWLARNDPLAEPSTRSRGAMFYTSGTTGRPKGVRRGLVDMRHVAQLIARTAVDAWGLSGPDDRVLVTGPLYHSAPHGYANAAITIGSRVVLQPRFDAEDFLALVERHRVTHAILVPTMFVRLLVLPERIRRRYDVSSLRCLTHGAAPCAPDVKRRIIDWFGPIVREHYGGTEIGLVTAATSEDAARKPGTVGRPIAGATIRIYDEAGSALAPGATGEVFVGMEGMPDFTYHGLDDKRREIGRDGLIGIGDMGYLDDEGFLFLRDRKIEMVISGGVNIYPAEVEAALITAPGVADCAVFGIPDEEFGEALCACVEPDPGEDVDVGTIREYLRERVAGYKVPRVIEFIAALPRDDSGKISKQRLKDPYWEGLDRRI